MTSGAATNARAYAGPYSTSKAALNALARTYAAETDRHRVRVNLFNPGPTRTRMRAQVMPGEDPMTLPTPEQVAEKIVELCLPSFTETGKLYDYPAGNSCSSRIRRSWHRDYRIMLSGGAFGRHTDFPWRATCSLIGVPGSEKSSRISLTR